MNPEITFRPLRDTDLPLMHRWLNDPAVVEWWEGVDVSWPAVVSRYGSGHTEPVEYWLALLDGDPLGWLQCYCAADRTSGETYYWQPHLDLRATGGIDYLVGEAGRRGRGIGSAMIRAFVRDVVFGLHPEWAFAAAGPFEANVPSCRKPAFARARHVVTLADEDGPCSLMVADRRDFLRDADKDADRP